MKGCCDSHLYFFPQYKSQWSKNEVCNSASVHVLEALAYLMWGPEREPWGGAEPLYLSCLQGQTEALLGHDACLQGTELPWGDNRSFLQVLQETTGSLPTKERAQSLGKMGLSAQHFLGHFCHTWQLGQSLEQMICWCEPRRWKLEHVGKCFCSKTWKRAPRNSRPVY